MNILQKIIKTFTKPQFNNTKAYIEKFKDAPKSNRSQYFEKFIEMPEAFGAFTEQENMSYDKALETLNAFLGDKSKVYLLGFQAKGQFYQIDRTIEGGGITLLMVNNSEASVMDQTLEVAQDDVL